MRGGEKIDFSVSPLTVNTTKSEVLDSNLKDEEYENLYVYAATSDGAVSSPVVNAPGARLYYDAVREVWNPKVVTGYNKTTDLEWEDGLYYTFYGFAFSDGVDINKDYDETDGCLTLDNSTYGRKFTVTQPFTGDGTNTIDYLLSSVVNVAPSANRPLVPIELEHAMARVDVDVQIAKSMFDENDACLVSGISVTVRGIKNKATMLCPQPKQYGDAGTNIWYVTFIKNSGAEEVGTSAYTKANIDNTATNREGGSTPNDMSFMAIPVTNTEMTSYELLLRYHGLLSGSDYEYSFDLKKFSPDGWVSGHKVKYVLTIDNSIHLSGSIVDYEDVDYIEAVIVPNIPGTK